jgi:hypothetical protein
LMPPQNEAVGTVAPLEYLGAGRPVTTGPRRRRRWPPVVAGVVTFVLVVIGGGLVVVDWVDRSLEMRQLVTMIDLSEKAMGDTQADITAAIDDFRSKPTPTPEDQAALETALKAAAAKGLEGVTHGGNMVASVRVLPWHSAIAAAQQAYLAHNRAWQEYLAKAAKDAAELGKKQDAVNATFEAAEQPMRAAIPRPDAFGLAERVDVIYAPDPGPDSGPGQQA